jgi:hypothetical protein
VEKASSFNRELHFGSTPSQKRSPEDLIRHKKNLNPNSAQVQEWKMVPSFSKPNHRAIAIAIVALAITFVSALRIAFNTGT